MLPNQEHGINNPDQPRKEVKIMNQHEICQHLLGMPKSHHASFRKKDAIGEAGWALFLIHPIAVLHNGGYTRCHLFPRRLKTLQEAIRIARKFERGENPV